MQWFAVSTLSSFSWLACEVLGGLAFLACGVRLWTYETMPLFWEITSPVIWLIAFVLMPPIFGFFEFVEKDQKWSRHRRLFTRLCFLIIVGCTLEVMINEAFKRFLGQPLFVYTLFPTFNGSGSLLSPFYYSTLYIHFPLLTWFRRQQFGTRFSVRTS